MASTSNYVRKTIVILGDTGVGKSTLANHLSGTRVLETSDGADSCTSKVSTTSFKVRGLNFTVKDTPGFNDSKGRDEEHLAELHRDLRQVDDCCGFLILFNFQQPRITEPTQRSVNYFRDMFGQHFASHAHIVVTNCPLEKRNKAFQFVEERRQMLREIIGKAPPSGFPAFLVDCNDTERDEADIMADLNPIIDQLMTMNVCSLDDVNIPETSFGKALRQMEEDMRKRHQAEIAWKNVEIDEAKTRKQDSCEEVAALREKREEAERRRDEVLEQLKRDMEELRQAQQESWIDRLGNLLVKVATGLLPGRG
eukprot:gb/GECG01007537.1/.p1 GENE.gb/GECG01007537.1/~~gb/GECG01007537.1/.p1  ORF type:complete len:310 (+),score=48.67 gb/GECG01007537.1/:1-930(+)